MEPTQPDTPSYPPSNPPTRPSMKASMSASVASIRSAFMSLSNHARGIVIIAVLVLMCGSCGIGSIAARGGGQPSTQANATTAHQATSQPTATPQPTRTPKPKAWVTVQHFTGASNQQTPTFSLPDGSRIVWSAQASNQYGGNFVIDMYNSDGTYNDLVANTITPPNQSGTYNVHGNLSVYLNIQTDGSSYDIAVQVYQ